MVAIEEMVGKGKKIALIRVGVQNIREKGRRAPRLRVI
jgi:hypothetical protein